MNNEFIIAKASEIEGIVFKALEKYGVQKQQQTAVKLYTVNQVAIILGKAHRTIKKLTIQGAIKITKSGLITQEALNEYLNQ